MADTSIVLSNREITPMVIDQIDRLAPTMHASRLFGVVSKEQAAAIMLKGYELGLSLSSSFEFLQVVDGKPSLSPRGALALIHNSKSMTGFKLTRLVDKNGKFFGYECWMKRGDDFEHTSRFTLEDAQQAQLVKPSGNWQKYPENMCQWRSIGFCADVVFPDLTGGLTTFLKMPEAYPNVQVSDTGDWFTAETKVIETPVEKVNPEKIIKELGFADAPIKEVIKVMQKPQTITLDELVNNFGAEEILKVNEGKIPGTDEEVQEVANKLLGG